MSKPRRASTLPRYTLALIALLAASLSGVVCMPGGFRASTASASALYAVPTTSVMVPAGGSAQLQVRGMSMQPGSTISSPPVSLAAQPVPPDNVRTALYYGINWGYTETDPEQAVLAVWYAQDGTWHGDKHSTAEQIQSAAAASPGTPSWSPSGRSALQLAGGGQIGLGDITLTPSQLSPSVGSGTLILTNTSDQELLVYLPYGTIFGTGPASVLVWAVGEVAQTLPSATPEDVLPQATDTVEVVESTPTATATVNAPLPGKKTHATSTATTEVAQEASPTQQAPVGKKSVATSTSTPAPTDTPLPTDTATVEPTATSIPTVPPTTAPAQAKNSAASQAAAPDQAANADVAAPEGSKAQSQAANDAAPDANKATSNNQNNVQPPADAGTTSADAQAPAPGKKGAGTTSVQEIGADQSSKTEALAPVVTITTIPRPVETAPGSADNRAAVPPAVQTSGATPPPPPVQTNNPTVPAGSTGVPTRPASARTGTPSPTRAATNSPTPASTADVPLRQPPQPVETAESVPSTQPSGEKTPIPVEPTQQVAPEPTRLTDLPTATASVPVIVTDPGGGTTDGGQGGVTVGSDSADGGTSPSVNPKTGGGPSPLPLLLSVSSVLLVLGGWQLRRVAARQSANSQR